MNEWIEVENEEGEWRMESWLLLLLLLLMLNERGESENEK